MRKTLAHLTLSTTPQETITAAGIAGFDGVGIRICGRHIGDDSFVNAIGDKAVIRELRQRASDGGVAISNVSAYQFYPGLTRDHLKAVVQTTVALGAPVAVVNCFIEDEREKLELFSTYAQLAADGGVRLALEFLPYSTVRTMAEARALIARSGAGNVGILLDALHLDRSGDTPASIGPLTRSEIVFAQLCDAKRRTGPAEPAELMQEARTARLPLGTGDLPLHDFVAALPDDLELEYEVADFERKHLPAADRAIAAMQDFDRFLTTYELKRNGVRS
jgi:sugar phosphate isomerase/epimerase